MSIKLVVFDIAGTTVKDANKVGEAFQEALGKHGFYVPVDGTAPFMGYEKKRAIRDILKKFHDKEIIDDAVIVRIYDDFTKQMIQYYEASDELELLPHVEETLTALHDSGKKIAINTGFSRGIADVIVNKFQLWESGLIDFLIASDEVKNGRPFPDMILSLMNQAGITDPKEVAKVGDTEVDINEGRNAGCSYCIGITTGSYTRSELRVHNPTHIIDNISEVLDIIKD
ncbi:HAD-IA family hydrolase [Arcticibacter eurypsychrophilus]|uniref:HAD-IA family hydrolase n=1 Tax=Arcticibacter eurypsychrophilus TaxID=1434752 RepID=UPI00084D65AA|nr:HAD-IA family hydrolase [Arcticibacter eurypsychrophilus]